MLSGTPISPEEFERLAYANGISNLAEAERQNARARNEIPTFLDGTVEEAWSRCLPEWKAFGRVRDRSHCTRAPKYWPGFARCLGVYFVETFRGDYEFLIQRLDDYAYESIEYLCVCDLIEMMLHEYAYDSPSVRERLFSLKTPLPPVVAFECQAQRDYSDHADSIGQYLRRIFSLDYEPPEDE